MSKVLVIDDEILISELISDVLAGYGHNVETASDGQQGIQVFDKQLFDVVITDIRMPGIDGHGVVKHIRESERPDTPIIAMSGTPFDLDDEVDFFLSKPFNITGLLDVFNNLASSSPDTPDPYAVGRE